MVHFCVSGVKRSSCVTSDAVCMYVRMFARSIIGYECKKVVSKLEGRKTGR